MKSAALDIAVDTITGSTRSDARPSNNSRNEILSAAAECFKENGFAATSIDDVARSLSATKGMIYHHFRSKMDLFFAVYQRGMEINFEAVRPQSEFSGDPVQTLARMGLAHSIALMAHQPFQRVLTQGVEMHQTGSTTASQRHTLVELIELRNTYEGLFRLAIENAIEGQCEITDLSLASKSFLAVLNGTVFWYSPREQNPQEEQVALAHDLVKFAMQGLGLKMPDVTTIDLEI